MRVRDCMSPDVQLAGPDDAIAQTARTMAECDIGCMPVAEGDRLVGMITDRDIAIRAIGEGMGPDAKVRDVMTAEVMYCFEHDVVDDVLNNMGDLQVRRLPVLDEDKRLVGIVSLSDLANGSEQPAGYALGLIARAGGEHSQTLH